MENQEVLKAIAVLADKVGRYHERLMFMERELEKHQKDEASHCDENCESKRTKVLRLRPSRQAFLRHEW